MTKNEEKFIKLYERYKDDLEYAVEDKNDISVFKLDIILNYINQMKKVTDDLLVEYEFEKNNG